MPLSLGKIRIYILWRWKCDNKILGKKANNIREISKSFRNYPNGVNWYFLKENINRIIYGVIGVLLILKALRMFFTNKLKSKK